MANSDKTQPPVGLLVAADAETIDSFRVASQRTRAQLATERLRGAAARRRMDRLTSNDITRLIRRTRQARSRGR